MEKYEIIAEERRLEDDRRAAEAAITLAAGRAAVSVEFTDTEIAVLERVLLLAHRDESEDGPKLEDMGISYDTWRMAFMKVGVGQRRLADARRC